jgi:hypothetical protein
MLRCTVLMILLQLIGSEVNGQINDGGTLPKRFLAPDQFSQIVSGVELDKPDISKLIEEDEKRTAENSGIERIGSLVQLDIGFKNGQWSNLVNGDRIWNLIICGKDAKALNLYFDSFHLPEGSTLHIYRPDRRQVLGGYSSHNNNDLQTFATELIYGEELVVEYFEPKSVKGLAKLHISEVGYVYREVDKPYLSNNRDFGDADNCHVNVNCSPEGNGKQVQRDAVVRILVKLDAGFGWCSGAMINNTNFDCKPYLLTAFQCGNDNGSITTASNFNQWIFYFNYQTTGCSNPGMDPIASASTISGASVLAYSGDPFTSNQSDFLLLELNQTVPESFNAYFAGWDRQNIASTGGYGIHHPSGDIKKISTFTSTLQEAVVGGSDFTHWAVPWVATTNGHGVSDDGSIGSPLFNLNGRIVGTMSVSISTCNSPTNTDRYGKMSYHWNLNGSNSSSRLMDWLDPGNTNLLQIDGASFPCASLDHDASVDTILYPSASIICENPISPIVSIVNSGKLPLSSVDINIEVNGSLVETFAWTGNLPTFASENVTLPAIMVTANTTNVIEVYTSNPNGNTDENTSNDAKSNTTLYYAPQNLPFAIDFAGNLHTGTFVTNPDEDDLAWAQNPSVGGFGNSTNSIMADNFNNDGRGTKDILTISPVDLSGNTDYQLVFGVAYARYDASFFDGLEITATVDCGESIQPLYSKSGSNLATAPDKTTFFVPSATEWRRDTVDLSAYAENDHLVLEFVNVGGFGQPIYIDNIKIEAVILGPYYNMDTGQRFATLAEALAAAIAGETVLLMANAEENSPIEIPTGINFIIQEPYTLTFKDP